jgi:MFS transporter, DHA1 family, multidrug resistance protein
MFRPVRDWFARWLPIMPILVAEAVVWVGFGAVLPVLPIFAEANGIGPATFGVIAAALPAARLVTEPFFGALADHVSRRPLLVAALALTAVAAVLPIVAPTVPLLLLSRAVAGIASAMFDPAARGLVVEMTPERSRGEAFGMYGSAQMGGLLLGPAIGAIGASLVGGFAFPFLLAAVTGIGSALYLAFALRVAVPAAPSRAAVTGADGQLVEAVAAASRVAPPGVEGPPVGLRAPLRAIANRLVIAATVMNFTLNFSVGVYEVIWSLYLERLGASLAWIGFTFTLFGIPVLLISPVAGRLVDRFGPLRFAVFGGLGVAGAGLAYTFATEPVLPAWITIPEGVAEAFVYPALFALVAIGTPTGRASTVQGLVGSAGTLAFVVSSLVAGILFEFDPRYPFYVFAAAIAIGVVAGAIVARGATAARSAPRVPAPATTVRDPG